FAPDALIERARQAKVQLLDHRIDVPNGNRDFPAYLDSNRFLSNLEGTTILFPVVDLSHQYINGMMYLLTQPAGARPTIVGRAPAGWVSRYIMPLIYWWERSTTGNRIVVPSRFDRKRLESR